MRVETTRAMSWWTHEAKRIVHGLTYVVVEVGDTWESVEDEICDLMEFCLLDTTYYPAQLPDQALRLYTLDELREAVDNLNK